MAILDLSALTKAEITKGDEYIVLTNAQTETGNARYPLQTLKDELQVSGSVGFQGEAVPTSPKPTKEGFWVVTKDGTYVNFGGVKLPPFAIGFIVYQGGKFSITYKQFSEDVVLKTEIKSTLNAGSPDPVNAKAVLDKGYVEQKNVLSNLDIASIFPVDSKAVNTTINFLEDTMKDYMNEQEFNAPFAYGVEWDVTAADPKLTRIGHEISHKTLPVHNLLRGCVLKANGEVNYYLDAKDWTKKEDGTASKIDGTDGDIMVEIPTLYFLAEQNGDKRTLKVLDRPFTGAKRFKKRYVSAYEATLERSTSTMRSVVNPTDNYKGHTGAKGNLAPLSAVSRATARSYARKRKGFEVMDITTYNILVWLYFIEFANRNAQLPVTAKVGGLTTGGLGGGITTLSDAEWNTYNGRYGLPVIGKSNSLGNGSGEVNVGVTEFKDAMMCRYRGVENLFGNVVKLLDGIQFYRDKEAGLFNIFISENPLLWNDSNNNEYAYIGEFPLATGYITDVNFPYNVPSKATGGSSTTFYCDNAYAPGDYTGYTWYGVGGTADSGAHAGVGYSHADNAVSASSTKYGFRLCFLG